MTDAQIKFAASKYRIVSLEKCTGSQNGTKTEEAIYATARRLKDVDPNVKVIFYWATDQQGISCYSAGETFAAHTEWHLKDDHGKTVSNGILDPTNLAAVAWWVSIPFGGINGTGMYKGTPVHNLIDGVLADSAGYSNFANISLTRLEAIYDAKKKMVGELQNIATAANDGIVMANGISMYGPPHADPRTPGDNNMEMLKFSAAIMNEHTAVFESVNKANASLNVALVSQDLDAMENAIKMENGSKTLFIQTWPGLYSGVMEYPPVANGGEPTPTNNEEWRNALRSHYFFAQALVLSIAEANVYWFYGATWYSARGGYLACPENLDSCPAPPEWYPDLKKPLGAPLGPRVETSPYVWTREFEHASVYLNFNEWNTSKVIFRA